MDRLDILYTLRTRSASYYERRVLERMPSDIARLSTFASTNAGLADYLMRSDGARR